MPDCRDCGRSHGRHHDWCPTKLKAVIVNRDWKKNCDEYAVPASRLREALEVAREPSRVTGKRRPTPYNNTEQHWDSREQLYEFPFNPDKPLYNYADEPRRGWRGPPGEEKEAKRAREEEWSNEGKAVGYGRIMATEDKRFRGYSMHPVDNDRRLERSPEIRQSRFPGVEKYVTYKDGCKGVGVTQKRALKGTMYETRDPRDYR